MAIYKFPEFNVEIENPTVIVTKVNDNILDRICSVDVILQTTSTNFGVNFFGYVYATDWNDTEIINWVNNVELPKYLVP